MLRRLSLLTLVPLAVGCSAIQDHGGSAAGAVGSFMTASELDLLEAEFLAGALIAYAIYDPFAPTWRVSVTHLDEQRIRLDLRMKGLVTGGEGEARQVFMRNVRQLTDEGGFSGFEIVRYEEGLESSRPLARRFASGEVRMTRSRTFPDF